jgi:peroxiredoxin
MMPTSASICEFGWKAGDFLLPATDGRAYALNDIKGAKGTVIVFICNHCPYVKSVIERMEEEAQALRAIGVAMAAICANDALAYPEDGFERMKAFAAQHRLTFPYLHDESQAVARAYDAVCTPDFFGFNAAMELQYRGRLDAGGKTAVPGARRELFEAMSQIAATGRGPAEQTPSMGCSIKWKKG